MAKPALPPIPGAVRLDDGQQELLRLLQATPAHLSGEQLGARLGLSRTAVWKRIERLRALGYQVDGSPRRGYRLAPGQDLLLPAEIRAALPLKWLRGPVYHFVSLPSTNDAAKKLARQGAPEGTLVLAETQSAGRGRLGRTWESPAGTGLYLSLLLRPPLPPVELPKLTLLAAVAVVEAIQTATGRRTGIKWPNDIIFQGKKLGGILTEMETESDAMRHVVLGVGLNLNTPQFPEHLQQIATSLAVTGQAYSRLATLRAFLTAMDGLYGRFLNEEFPAILERWRQFSVTLGKTVTIRQGRDVYAGLALDVAPDGALLLARPDGTVAVILSGEIQQASYA
ncbi:MAG: biotin--[acetyl-CoA-carboxylase] ligase [Desulfobacca sp.]|uniref:biotin--[acetyl-CoA-carboxylase] ligase n=1 Tax=Desulfobacca sp. TaxID=2067990 RepID=UPI004049534F